MKPDGPEPPEAITYANTPPDQLVGMLAKFRPHVLEPSSPWSMTTRHCQWAYEVWVISAYPEGLTVEFVWETARERFGQQLAMADELHIPSLCRCRACKDTFAAIEGVRWRGGDWRHNRIWPHASADALPAVEPSTGTSAVETAPTCAPVRHLTVHPEICASGGCDRLPQVLLVIEYRRSTGETGHELRRHCHPCAEMHTASPAAWMSKTWIEDLPCVPYGSAGVCTPQPTRGRTTMEQPEYDQVDEAGVMDWGEHSAHVDALIADDEEEGDEEAVPRATGAVLLVIAEKAAKLIRQEQRRREKLLGSPEDVGYSIGLVAGMERITALLLTGDENDHASVSVLLEQVDSAEREACPPTP